MASVLWAGMIACASTTWEGREDVGAPEDSFVMERLGAAEEVPAEVLLGEQARPSPVVRDVGHDEEKLCGARLFDGQILSFDLQIDDFARAALAEAPRREVPARLTWEGETTWVALRLKGSASFRTLDGKPSFKIRVDEGHHEARLDGCRRLTLNNMVQDGTMLRQAAHYGMSARMGLPAPRHAWANVTVDGEPYGVYALVESVDAQFVARSWPDDAEGNLYEASGADFTPERDWHELEQDGGMVDAPDDLRQLVDRIAAAPPGDVLPTLSRSFDVEALLDTLALDTAAGNADGYVFNRHNYFAYHAPRADRWSLVPWGTDRAFTTDVPSRGDAVKPVVGVLARRCWEDVACAARLEPRIAEMAERLRDEVLPGLREDAARIAALCTADPRRESRCRPDVTLDFIAHRPETLQASPPEGAGTF